MPGMTLIGEALTFAHDAQLLGFCPDDPDEPHGDDFATRCKEKQLGRWIDSRDPQITLQDIKTSGNADDEEGDIDEEGEMPYDEVRSTFERFCDMSSRAQAQEVDRLKHLGCRALNVDIWDFEIPDGFVLDAIERGHSDHEFIDEVRHSFSIRFGFVEMIKLSAADRALVAKVARMEDHWDFAREDIEGGDAIHIGQMSARCHLPLKVQLDHRANSGRSRHSRTMKPKKNPERFPPKLKGGQRVRHFGKQESHSAKYGRQDYRHQLPRIEAKHERRAREYEAEMEARYGDDGMWIVFSSHEEEVKAPELLSVWGQMQIPAWELRGGGDITVQDVADLGDYLREQRCIMDEMLEEFHPEDCSKRFPLTRPLSWSYHADYSAPSLFDFDYDEDYWGDDEDYYRRGDEDGYESLSEMLAKKFGDRERDIFLGYGEADDGAIDRVSVAHSSRLRVTGRFNPKLTKVELRALF